MSECVGFNVPLYTQLVISDMRGKNDGEILLLRVEKDGVIIA